MTRATHLQTSEDPPPKHSASAILNGGTASTPSGLSTGRTSRRPIKNQRSQFSLITPKPPSHSHECRTTWKSSLRLVAYPSTEAIAPNDKNKLPPPSLRRPTDQAFLARTTKWRDNRPKGDSLFVEQPVGFAQQRRGVFSISVFRPDGVGWLGRLGSLADGVSYQSQRSQFLLTTTINPPSRTKAGRHGGRPSIE